MRLVRAVRIAEIFSGVVLVLFALTVPWARWLVLAGFILAASAAFYASSRLFVTRVGQVVGIALALIILVLSLPRVVRSGIPVLPNAAAAISYSLALLHIVCQLFVLIVAVRILLVRPGSGS
jgi:hypothetical protein